MRKDKDASQKLTQNGEPSENPGLKVGDTIEITDARSHSILGGMAVAIGKHR